RSDIDMRVAVRANGQSEGDSGRPQHSRSVARPVRLARARPAHSTHHTFLEATMRTSLFPRLTRSVSAPMVGALGSGGIPAPARANVITDWDDKAVVVVTPMSSLGGGTVPYRAQRFMGLVHAAMFDAVNSIDRRYQPYMIQLPADPGTSKEAAAAAAAAAVLSTIDEKTAADMKAALAANLPPIA